MLIQVELSDDELCRRIAERDADAFELMVDRHQAHAYRLAYSILGNEADARDVSQDAFIRLYEAAGDRSDDASNAQCIDLAVFILCAMQLTIPAHAQSTPDVEPSNDMERALVAQHPNEWAKMTPDQRQRVLEQRSRIGS
jgi:Sigma-70 region 2